MMDRILAFAAFLALAGFLAILIWNVRQPALIVVVLVTLVLVLIDFLRSPGGTGSS